MGDAIAFAVRGFFILLPIAFISTLAWVIVGILWLCHHVSFVWR